MKRLVFIFFILPISLIAQEWAPIGAKWTYESDNGYGNDNGYVTIESVAEQMMGNKMTKKLYIDKYWYDYQLDSVMGTGIGVEYTYLDSGKVYYYRDNKFYILYNFNAQPSDTWSVHGYMHQDCDSTNAAIRVDSLGTMIVGNDTLNYLRTRASGFSNYDFSWGKLVEKIGCLGFMFPYQQCLADFEPQHGPLRCYEDSALTYHNPFFYEDSCNQVDTSYIGFDNYNNFNHIFFYPNPTTGKFSIQVTGARGQEVQVFDLLGRLVYPEVLEGSGNNEMVIDLGPYPAGIYFVRVGEAVRKVVKQ